jgi:hypothetical protein
MRWPLIATNGGRDAVRSFSERNSGWEHAVIDARTAGQFEVRRVSHREWVIYDVRFERDDARCVVACVRETDDEDAEVVWLGGRMMPTRYASVDAVIEDLTTATLRRRGGTRPIEIPHLPPPRLAG